MERLSKCFLWSPAKQRFVLTKFDLRCSLGNPAVKCVYLFNNSRCNASGNYHSLIKRHKYTIETHFGKASFIFGRADARNVVIDLDYICMHWMHTLTFISSLFRHCRIYLNVIPFSLPSLFTFIDIVALCDCGQTWIMPFHSAQVSCF